MSQDKNQDADSQSVSPIDSDSAEAKEPGFWSRLLGGDAALKREEFEALVVAYEALLEAHNLLQDEHRESGKKERKQERKYARLERELNQANKSHAEMKKRAEQTQGRIERLEQNISKACGERDALKKQGGLLSKELQSSQKALAKFNDVDKKLNVATEASLAELKAKNKKLAKASTDAKKKLKTLDESLAAQKKEHSATLLKESATLSDVKRTLSLTVGELDTATRKADAAEGSLELLQSMLQLKSRFAAQVLARSFGRYVFPAVESVWRGQLLNQNNLVPQKRIKTWIEEQLVASRICSSCVCKMKKGSFELTVVLTNPSIEESRWIGAFTTELLRNALGVNYVTKEGSFEKDQTVFSVLAVK